MKGDFVRLEVLAIELKVWRSYLQCHMFRLETRARELTVMASLNLDRVEAKGNQVRAVYNEAKRVKVRRVIAARLETRRSIRGQAEVGRKPDGGLKQF